MQSFRVQSEFVYRVITATEQTYSFTVVVGIGGGVGYRNLIGPQGPIQDPNQILPEEVNTAIQQAIQQVRDIMTATSALSGQAVFDNQTSVEILFDTPMSSTSYRVHLDAPDFVSTRVKYKATTGFIIDVGVTYTGTVGFDVFL